MKIKYLFKFVQSPLPWAHKPFFVSPLSNTDPSSLPTQQKLVITVIYVYSFIDAILLASAPLQCQNWTHVFCILQDVLQPPQHNFYCTISIN